MFIAPKFLLIFTHVFIYDKSTSWGSIQHWMKTGGTIEVGDIHGPRFIEDEDCST